MSFDTTYKSCEKHGLCVHARAIGATTPHICVSCAVAALAALSAKQAK